MDSYISNKDGERISPAVESLQRATKDLLQDQKDSSDRPTDTFGTQKLAITTAGGLTGRGENQACKSVEISTSAGSVVYMTVLDTVNEDTDADSEDFLLPAGDDAQPYKLVVNNVGRLRFYGANGNNVHILWRK